MNKNKKIQGDFSNIFSDFLCFLVILFIFRFFLSNVS